MYLFQSRSFKLLVFLLPLLALSGCKNKVIHVNTFADLAILPYGLPKDSKIYVYTNLDTLLELEVKIKLHLLLSEKNYTITDLDNAEYVLAFSYDQTHHKELETVGYYNHQFISYVPELHNYYNKTLVLYIFDAQKFAQKKRIWESIANCDDQDNNLREDLDYLLLATIDYFGVNTKMPVKKWYARNGKEAKNLREKFWQNTNQSNKNNRYITK